MEKVTRRLRATMDKENLHGHTLVLYVYRCTTCGHSGQVHLVESLPEVTTACTACGAEVLAEWDGGIELTTQEPK